MTTLPSLDDPSLTVPQVAKIFGVKNYTVRQWLKDEQLIGYKLPNSQWRILQSKVNEFAQKMYGGSDE